MKWSRFVLLFFISVSIQAGQAVVSPEPLAASVGMQILEQGGNAADAAVAIGFALAVTYPQAGNVAGGGFAMVFTPGGEPVALDFRETAPAAAHPRTFQQPDGTVIPDESTLTTRSVGVPGTIRGLHELWRSHGSLDWAVLIAPAVRLAREGVIISDFQHDRINRFQEKLGRDPDSRALFLPDGNPLPAGHLWKQPELARSLETIAKKGADSFYGGKLGKRFVRELAKKGGIMSQEDLAAYRAVWRTPIHHRFRGDDLYMMPLPSSGGIVIAQVLTMLDWFQPERLKAGAAGTVHLLSELERRAYADRNTYLGDPDHFSVIWQKLLDPEYLAVRADSVDLKHASNFPTIGPGLGPLGKSGIRYAESDQTTAFAVVDRKEMAISITYTLNGNFGCGILLKDTGMLLNNEMDDFAVAPGVPNSYGLVGGLANAVAPGKRMLSSMTPTIVLRKGRFHMALGCAGGSRIITTILHTYLNAALFRMDATEALASPRFHHQWLPDAIRVEDAFPLNEDRLRQLKSMGHAIESVKTIGNAILVIQHDDGSLDAAADPRGSGIAVVN